VAGGAVAAEEVVRVLQVAALPGVLAGHQRQAGQLRAQVGQEVGGHRQAEEEHRDQGEQDPRRGAARQPGLREAGRLGPRLRLGLEFGLVDHADFDAGVEVGRRLEQLQPRGADLDHRAGADRGRVGDLAVDLDPGQDQRFDLVAAGRDRGDPRVLQRHPQVGHEDRLVGAAADGKHVAVVDVLLVGDRTLALAGDAADQPAHGALRRSARGSRGTVVRIVGLTSRRTRR